MDSNDIFSLTVGRYPIEFSVWNFSTAIMIMAEAVCQT